MQEKIREAEKEFFANYPKLVRVPKHKRHEIRDQVRSELLVNALPTPKVIPVVWDLFKGKALVGTVGKTDLERVETFFRVAFEGAKMLVVPAIDEARDMDLDLYERVEENNQAATDSVLEKIEANTWLGRDFLWWLLWRSVEGRCNFTSVNYGRYTAYIGNKMVVEGSSGHERQKLSISGPLDTLMALRTALNEGKVPTSGSVVIECEEGTWSFVVVHDRPLDKFSSFKTPAILVEVNEESDAQDGFCACLTEKYAVVWQGLGLYRHLFGEFLKDRFSQGWAKIQQDLQAA